MHPFRTFFLFGVSGALGFAADTVVLYAFKGYFGLFFARLLSFLVAVVVTWVFNRMITFCHMRSGMKVAREFLAYFLLMLVGGAVNFGLYAWLVVAYGVIAKYPVIGVGAGSLAGMLVNLATSRYALFRRPV